MPNWCVNKITITGDKKKLKKLKKKINDFKTISKNGNKIFFMEYLIGLGNIPHDYDKREKYRQKRFGTERDFDIAQVDLHFTDDSIQINVESAWSPIIQFLSKLCKNYKVSAMVDYFESMQDFGGRAQIDINGVAEESRYSFREALLLFDSDNYWEVMEPYIQKMDMQEYEDFSMRWGILNRCRVISSTGF